MLVRDLIRGAVIALLIIATIAVIYTILFGAAVSQQQGPLVHH